MRSINQLSALFVAALLLGVSATNGAAQLEPGTFRPDMVFPEGYVLPAPVEEHIQLGDELVGEREFGEARTEYRTAVDLIQADGGFPGIALRRIADSYYFEGKYQHAIASLDRLADEASEVGDLVTQAWALADAAWVLMKDAQRAGKHARPGATMEVKNRLAQLEQLLDSPYLPEDVRVKINTKRCDGDCSTS